MTISDEAVEAAVKAWDHHWGDRYGDEALEEMGEEVRVALEAAAPHLMAKAWDEGHERGFWNGRTSQLIVPYDASTPLVGKQDAYANNPYRPTP